MILQNVVMVLLLWSGAFLLGILQLLLLSFFFALSHALYPCANFSLVIRFLESVEQAKVIDIATNVLCYGHHLALRAAQGLAYGIYLQNI